MKGFLGVLSRQGEPIRNDEMASACHDFVCRSKQSLLQHVVESQNYWATGFSSPENIASIIAEDADAGLVLVGHVDIYNRRELCERLHVDDRVSDPCLLLKAYRKWAEDCVRYINGDFAFAILNTRERSLFCARDPLGQRPLYYYANDQFFVFANWIRLLSGHSAASEIDDEWIIKLLLFNKRTPADTAFKNIKSLPPGHTLVVRSGAISIDRYWDITEAKPAKANSYEEAVEGFRCHLNSAIENRLRRVSSVGVELSGGIDSVSISTLAQQILRGNGGQLHAALTNRLPSTHKTAIADFCDEWDVASRVTADLKIRKHISVEDYLVDIHNSLERVLDVQGMPTSSIFGVSQENLYSTAAGAGVTALFTGFGGNEVVTEYSTDRYRYNCVCNWQLAKLYKSFKNPHVNISSALKSTGYFYGSYLYNVEKRKYQQGVTGLLGQSLLKNELLGAVRKVYDPVAYYYPNETIEERCLSQIRHPSMTNRIEAGYCFTSRHGLTYMHPLLDIPLLEYYYHLLPEWKVADRRGRGVFRAAMKGNVPDDILFQQKSNQTSTFPFYRIHFAGNFEKLKSYVLSLPRDKQIFDYVDREKVTRLELPPDNAKFPYYLLRMIVMTDLFFDQRKNSVSYEL